MISRPMPSKWRPLRVARGTPSVSAWAAISESKSREPTRCPPIKMSAPNSPHLAAEARSKVAMRSWCRAINRSSQEASMVRCVLPRVVRIPMVNSATTIVERRVWFLRANNQSTTRLSGLGLVSSLKTLVSIKIIELERDDTIAQSSHGKINLNAGPRHGDQLMHPVVIRRSGNAHCLRLIRRGAGSVRPIHCNVSPYDLPYSIAKAA